MRLAFLGKLSEKNASRPIISTKGIGKLYRYRNGVLESGHYRPMLQMGIFPHFNPDIILRGRVKRIGNTRVLGFMVISITRHSQVINQEVAF